MERAFSGSSGLRRCLDDDGASPRALPTLHRVSKTEDALTSADPAHALDDLFDVSEFDDAMGDALDDASRELHIAELQELERTDDLDDDLIEVAATIRISDDTDEAASSNGSNGASPDADTAEEDDELADVARADEPDLDEAERGGLETDDDAADALYVPPTEDDAGAIDSPADVDDDLDGPPAPGDDSPTRPHSVVAAADLDDRDTDDLDADEDDYELPEIVPATPDAADGDDHPDDTLDPDGMVAYSPVIVAPPIDRESPVSDPDLDDPAPLDPADDFVGDEVSDDILEELRRADIDGPVVDLAPQDDTANARRRPRRSKEYDPAPVPIPAQIPRVLGRKPRVRKVTRVVRHVDPWSVFKIALVANLVLYVIVLTAGVLLWNVAHATGTVDNIERFFESFGWESFEFSGGEIYHAAWIAGLFAVVGLTGLAVLAATLFNLITDLVGGMRFTVLEEEVVETRVSPMRRFVVRRPEPVAPARLHDQSGSMIREAIVDDTGANQRPTR